jgi:hypothetical protein
MLSPRPDHQLRRALGRLWTSGQAPQGADVGLSAVVVGTT